MKIGAIKAIGLAASVLGMGLTLISEWAKDKQLDATVAEKVAEAISKKTES